MRFHIYRTGFHPQNNPESDGGPETVMVAEIDADSKEDALDRAFESGVTSYPGQRVWVEKA